MNDILRLLVITFIWILLVVTGLAQKKPALTRPTPNNSLTAQEIAKRYLTSVVLIVCDDGKGKVSQGSGFFIGEGKILTNNHVIDGLVRGKVKVSVGGKNSREWWIHKVLQVDRELDLALLEIKTTTFEGLGYGDEKGNITKKIRGRRVVIDPGSSPLNLSSLNEISIGERIYVLSNPKGFAGSISQGIVSGEIRKVGKVDLLQIDAPISAGSSGGPVLSSRGEVVGIATGSFKEGQNLNFAVPTASIVSFLAEREALNNGLPFAPVSPVENSWQGQVNRIPPTVGTGLGKGRKILKNDEEVFTKKGENVIKPSLEETTLWITGKLHNTKPAFNRRIETLQFRGCAMTYKVRFIGNEGFEIVSLYSATLTNLESVETGIGSGFDEKVFLEFNQNVDEGKSTFYLGKPYRSEQTKTARIVIFTTDSEMGKRVNDAFLRLKEICSVKVKEPF